MSDKGDLSMSWRDVADGVGDMTDAERAERIAYERGDGALHETLATMTPNQRREAVDADTTIDPYQERKSRNASLAIAACLTGFLAVVVAVVALMEVLP